MSDSEKAKNLREIESFISVGSWDRCKDFACEIGSDPDFVSGYELIKKRTYMNYCELEFGANEKAALDKMIVDYRKGDEPIFLWYWAAQLSQAISLEKGKRDLFEKTYFSKIKKALSTQGETIEDLMENEIIRMSSNPRSIILKNLNRMSWFVPMVWATLSLVAKEGNKREKERRSSLFETLIDNIGVTLCSFEKENMLDKSESVESLESMFYYAFSLTGKDALRKVELDEMVFLDIICNMLKYGISDEKKKEEASRVLSLKLGPMANFLMSENKYFLEAKLDSDWSSDEFKERLPKKGMGRF